MSIKMVIGCSVLGVLFIGSFTALGWWMGHPILESVLVLAALVLFSVALGIGIKMISERD